MYRFLPLLVLVASCSRTPVADAMSDEAFAQATLSRASIGQSLSTAEASLRALKLDCSEVVPKPIPGTTPNPEFRTVACSRPSRQDQCVQSIELLARSGCVVMTTLHFEQLPGSKDGSACGR